MTPQHRPAPFVALVAGVSLSVWLIVNAGIRTTTTQPVRLSEPPADATTSTSASASEISPRPSPGPELTLELR